MLVTIPPAPVAKDIEWTIDQPAQVNRSQVTKKRRVTLLPQAPRWYAKVTLPPILGERNVMAWRAFVVDLDGVANTFRLVACEGDQIAGNLDVRVAAGAQTGFLIPTTGWGAAGAKLLRGQFVTIADQLLMLMADVVADANGAAQLAVKPFLRVKPSAGDRVEVKRPYAVVSMSDPKNGWAVGIGQNYAITFSCEEP